MRCVALIFNKCYANVCISYAIVCSLLFIFRGLILFWFYRWNFTESFKNYDGSTNRLRWNVCKVTISLIRATKNWFISGAFYKEIWALHYCNRITRFGKGALKKQKEPPIAIWNFWIHRFVEAIKSNVPTKLDVYNSAAYSAMDP